MTWTWPALREFLAVPDALTGRGVPIAVVDGTFVGHPDVAGNARRRTWLVPAAAPDPRPVPLPAAAGLWSGSAQHGVWAAAAAAGTGALSGGRYAGVAPEAELYLVAGWRRGVTPDGQARTEAALRWLLAHGEAHGIRAVMPTAQSGPYGTGLLPWQLDPIRVLCEALAAAGFLVVAGTGNVPDLTCDATQAQAPSVLAVGGVVLPAGAGREAAAYHGCRGTTFAGKWVPELLAPADNLVLPWIGEDAERGRRYAGAVPTGYLRTGGTSFAGPALLGAAACVWQAHPEWPAARVRAALLGGAAHRPQWGELRAGLVSVAGAVSAGEPLEDVPPRGETPAETPYARYRRWRRAAPAERARAIAAADSAEALDALQSLLPRGPDALALDRALVGVLRDRLRGGPAPLRASALCVLAGQPGALSGDALAAALRDPARAVRAAAVYALERCPVAWPTAVPLLPAAFADESLNVRVAALRLAGTLHDARLVGPLVRGLEEDVRARRLANWSARRRALTALTGVEIAEDPPWQPGESPDSEGRWQARARAAAAWRARVDAPP